MALAPLFGIFLDPTVSDPREPFRLAQIADENDLDLLTIQDHPYQWRFYETWTLLTALAMATERIHVSPITSPTCRCVCLLCWRSRRPPSTCLQAAESSWGWVLAGSGTRLPPMAGRNGHPPKPTPPLKTLCTSCAACGTTPADHSPTRARYTPSKARSLARPRRTASPSGRAR